MPPHLTGCGTFFDMRVQVFIDGFNLYHSIMSDPQLRHCRWLSFHSLAQSILSSRETLSGIYFFTAFYPGDPSKRRRHQTLIDAQALYGVETVLGAFRRKDKHCPNCKQSRPGYEEKETDVNIALWLLRNAYEDRYDKAVIVSNDSDLIPAIKMLREVAPLKRVMVVFPPGNASNSLKEAVGTGNYMRLN